MFPHRERLWSLAWQAVYCWLLAERDTSVWLPFTLQGFFGWVGPSETPIGVALACVAVSSLAFLSALARPPLRFFGNDPWAKPSSRWVAVTSAFPRFDAVDRSRVPESEASSGPMSAREPEQLSATGGESTERRSCESTSFPVEIPFERPPPPPGAGPFAGMAPESRCCTGSAEDSCGSRLSRCSMASRSSIGDRSATLEALQQAAATAFPAGSYGAALAAKLSQQKADAMHAKATSAADYKARKHIVYDTERALRRALEDHERSMQFEAPAWGDVFSPDSPQEIPGGLSSFQPSRPSAPAAARRTGEARKLSHHGFL